MKFLKIKFNELKNGFSARLFLFLFAGLAPIAGLARAADDSPPIQDVDDIIYLANRISQWVATLFWIAAAAAVFYAGFIYMAAADDTEKVKKAKKQLIYSVVAIAIGLLAYAMPAIVRNVLRGG